MSEDEMKKRIYILEVALMIACEWDNGDLIAEENLKPTGSLDKFYPQDGDPNLSQQDLDLMHEVK